MPLYESVARANAKQRRSKEPMFMPSAAVISLPGINLKSRLVYLFLRQREAGLRVTHQSVPMIKAELVDAEGTYIMSNFVFWSSNQPIKSR
jgi:hypothetical protein